MERVYECCCGIDVHKKMIVACLKKGSNKPELRQIGTMTYELKELAQWLIQAGCQMVAMESTGSYWKPIYNILEVMGIEVMVVNARHMKAVPGRKTDVKDAQWIAELLMHGLLQASYIPGREQRELRELTRYKRSLTEERARELNRLQKVLEGANIKLSSVLKEVDGFSSRGLLEKLIAGEELTEDIVKSTVHSSVLPKLDQIMTSIDGLITPLQKHLLRCIIDHIDDMTKRIKDIDNIIKKYLDDYQEAIERLDEIPGIGVNSAQMILAEIGLNMDRFPTAAHLCSWAGLSPGNNMSAGKSKSGKTTKGNITLKVTLKQSAVSASKNKASFFSAQYQRIAVRRGKGRATVAVAHSILIAIYHIVKNKVAFKDLSSDYYNGFNKEKKIKSLLGKLQKLGWNPTAEITG